MVRVKPSALMGAALLLVLVLAIVGVRTAWAQRGAEPVPVATTGSASTEAATQTGQALADGGGTEPVGSEATSTVPTTESAASAMEPVAAAYVHVIGAVVSPGVVEVPAGSRVSDVVEAGGGLSRKADLSRVNLARVVVDAERIWIPVEGEELPTEVGTPAPALGAAPDAVDGGAAANGTASGDTAPVQIDLNLADSATLQALPGVGPVTAESILTWRAENGQFATIDELLEVSGIGPRTLEKLRPRVIVGAP